MSALLLTLALAAAQHSSEARLFKSQGDLQIAVDAILDRCNARPNLRAAALNEKLVKVDFVDPPLDLSQDTAFRCVMDAAQKLSGVTFGVIGREQYIDNEGNRH